MLESIMIFILRIKNTDVDKVGEENKVQVKS